jgi:hypothetical protein
MEHLTKPVNFRELEKVIERLRWEPAPSRAEAP